MSADPIRAQRDAAVASRNRLEIQRDAMCERNQELAIELRRHKAALRAVLDLCDDASEEDWHSVPIEEVHRVVTEHLGVTDGS